MECCNQIVEVFPSQSETHCHKDSFFSKHTTEFTLICLKCKTIIKVPINKPLEDWTVDESKRSLVESFLNKINK